MDATLCASIAVELTNTKRKSGENSPLLLSFYMQLYHSCSHNHDERCSEHDDESSYKMLEAFGRPSYRVNRSEDERNGSVLIGECSEASKVISHGVPFSFGVDMVSIADFPEVQE